MMNYEKECLEKGMSPEEAEKAAVEFIYGEIPKEAPKEKQMNVVGRHWPDSMRWPDVGRVSRSCLDLRFPF